MKKKTISRSALSISIILLILWALLGTGSTIAWFRDTASAVNTVTIGDVDIELYRKTSEGYSLVDSETKLFDDRALYEPGYTQIILLKIRNAGTVDFDYKFSVVPTNIVDGMSVTGMPIHLPDYLKFGLVIADTEEEVAAVAANRIAARERADTDLSTYSKTKYALAPEGEHYAALIVCMPETVGNEANYRDTVPSVELGVRVKASQIGTIDKLG